MDPLYSVRQAVATYVSESGKNPADPEVLEAINEARRIVYPLGDWKDTLEPIVLHQHSGQITLPGWADSIREAGWCNHELDIDNQWYSAFQQDGLRNCTRNHGLIDLGPRFCTFKPYHRNFRIKVKSLDVRDKGVELTFHCVSEHGEPVLLTRILSDAWKDVISDPISDKWVRSISACNKPVTHDRVLVYIYDPVRDYESLCAVYEANETNPQYRRYKVHHKRHVVAKVKKKFKELVDDRELVDIHTDALIHLLQAVTSRKNRDPQMYAAMVKSARDYLDRDIKSVQPMQTHRLRMDPKYNDTNLGFECYPYSQ